MRKFFPALILAVLLIPSTASAELRLTMEGGLVTIIAKDVPLATIMAEWAKVGKTQILNGDKIFTPVTLQLENVPERKALDILLRGAAGYMLAERTTPVAGASTFDRIMILPTSRPPANAPPLQQSPAPFNTPRPMPTPVVPDDDDQPNQPNPAGQNPATGQPGNAPLPGMPTAPPTTGQQPPLTAPRPGMLPPPQQPVPFGAPRPGGTAPNPGAPVKPGGGGGL